MAEAYGHNGYHLNPWQTYKHLHETRFAFLDYIDIDDKLDFICM